MQEQLLEAHQKTYDAVFQHPISRGIAWRDIHAMLNALRNVVLEEHEWTLKLTRNGRSMVLHRPYHKTLSDVRELMNLRRFLEQSATHT
ncbi:MAG: hypothetical protein ACREJC_16070 [Tepidisphaeraceae bacterium]